MILVILLIGAILVVAAVRNSQDALFAALKTDVPGYIVWAAAIMAIGAVGYLPGLKPVSRGLLILVLVVIILHNYTKIIGDFQSLWKSPQPTSTPAKTGSSTDASNTTTGGSIFQFIDQLNPATLSETSFGTTLGASQA